MKLNGKRAFPIVSITWIPMINLVFWGDAVCCHCIHLCEEEWQRISETQSGIAFCPTSNLFLGSGLFNLKKASEENINVGMGTDVGGGTSFSILQTLNEAYKVLQLRDQTISVLKCFIWQHWVAQKH